MSTCLAGAECHCVMLVLKEPIVAVATPVYLLHSVLSLLSPVYTIQPVVKPVGCIVFANIQPVVK